MQICASRRLFMTAGVGAAALVLTACSGGSGGSTSSATSTGAVTMHLDGPLTSYDPLKGASFQDAVVNWALYDTLVSFDPDGKVIPDLADSWTTTPTGATFKLHPGVSCSDGTALTSQMVAASLQRFLNPASAAPFLNLVVGSSKNPATVTAPDAKTVTVHTQKPWSGLLSGLTSPSTGIVCPAGLKNPAALLTTSQGTGAFVSASQVSGASYTLTRRAGYTWGPKYANAPSGTPPKTLKLQVVQDESTRANLMDTGKLQIATYVTDAWNRFKGRGGFDLVTEPQSDTMLLFNENSGHPTADPAVRNAISQALNRNTINQVQSFGAGELIDNLGEKSYECNDTTLNTLLPAAAPQAASSVLKGKKISIIGTNLLAGGDANTYLLTAMKAAGADAKLSNMNNQAWVGDLFAGKNDWDITILVLGNTVSSLLESGGFFVGAAPSAGQNLGNVHNPAAAAAFTRAGSSVGAAKCQALSEFQKALLTNRDVLPLSTAPAHTLFTGGTHGVVVKGFVQAGSIRISK